MIRTSLFNAFIIPFPQESGEPEAKSLLLTYQSDSRCVSWADRYICKRPIRLLSKESSTLISHNQLTSPTPLVAQTRRLVDIPLHTPHILVCHREHVHHLLHKSPYLLYRRCQ